MKPAPRSPLAALATLDPTALNAIGWNLTAPSDGVSAPCVANFTVSDVAFVTN